MISHRAIGNHAEDLACAYLEEWGYQILARNFTIRGGELDIVTQKDEMIVVVEVKARHTHDFGLPEEAITLQKLRFLQRALALYLHMFHLDNYQCRIDLMTIDYSQSELPKIEIIESITG